MLDAAGRPEGAPVWPITPPTGTQSHARLLAVRQVLQTTHDLYSHRILQKSTRSKITFPRNFGVTFASWYLNGFAKS